MKMLNILKRFTTKARNERKINKLEEKLNVLEDKIDKNSQERDILYKEIRLFNEVQASNNVNVRNCGKVFDLALRKNSINSTIQSLSHKRDNLIVQLVDSVG